MDTPENSDQTGEILRVDPPPTCSPSSLTPETNVLADEIYARGIKVSEIKMLQHARTLERERDEARHAIRQWIDAWDRYGDGASLTHPRLTMALTAARKSLLENAPVLAQPGHDSTKTKNGL